MTTGPGVVWFRRDLRLDDQPAWSEATRRHDEVVALVVLEPGLLAAAGDHRRDQFLAHVHALHRELTERGGGLTVRDGPAATAVPDLLSEVSASGLYLNAEHGPFARRRDSDVTHRAPVRVVVRHGGTVHEPGSVLTRAGRLSKVFAPFFRRWESTPRTPWPGPDDARIAVARSRPIPRPAGRLFQEPGSDAAWERLSEWVEHVDDYDSTRDIPALAGTSALSADLHFGTLSARTVVDVIGAGSEGRRAFARQLAWRDWWAHTLAEHADLAVRPLNARAGSIRWRVDPEGLAAWCEGMTGFPMVDAGMRQLAATGWMHNRVRMVCASFLVKDLLIDWRKGERFFRRHLVDGDVAQNAGNWQWVAGTGPDAAPFFRIFNPTTQARRFDPEGRYIRRWVPELARLGPPALHEPNAAGPLELAGAGVTIGIDYPAPVVEHGEARERALAAYRATMQ